MIARSIRSALEHLQQVIQIELPGSPPIEELRVVFVGGRKMTLPAFCSLDAGPCREEEKPFVPTAFQADILDALDGKALRADALGHKVGDRSRLYRRPGGLHELREEGLVCLHKRLGYYRPDAPPPELEEEEST